MRAEGLTPNSLITYLACLGLTKALAQEDPEVETHWEGDTFVIDSSVDDIPTFLLERYSPTPVISPWNGGSGFGPKDKNQRATLEQVADPTITRLADFAATYRVAQEVFDTSQAQSWPKERLIQELRNRLPERALPWIDTAIVLTPQAPTFPIVLGTGGNDGRLEFSANFHKRLIDILPELGADEHKSRGWIHDLLTGEATTPLVRGAVGQSDPAGAAGPNSSPTDEGNSVVNPWGYVLMIEGSTYFAASPARRIAANTPARAAMPFTVYFSADGPHPGAAEEEARGEIWAPVWADALPESEVHSLYRRAKATWNGETVTRAANMYAATRSFGVDRGIDRFIRYPIVQRNGLAYVAVRSDVVTVKDEPGIEVLIPLQARWQPFQRLATNKFASLVRRLRTMETRFAREVTGSALLDLLAAQTELELAAARSTAARDAIASARGLVTKTQVFPLLRPLLETEPEIRLAAALASGSFPLRAGAAEDPAAGKGRRLFLRALVVGDAPQRRGDAWQPPVVDGLTVRPLISVLADAAVWRDQHAAPDNAGAQRGIRFFTWYDYRPSYRDAHLWAQGLLDDSRLEHALLACFAIDWRGPQEPVRDRGSTVTFYPLPSLAILQALASGQLAAGEGSPGDNSARQGLPRGWALRLRAGHTASVLAEGAALTNRLAVAGAPFDWVSERHNFEVPQGSHEGERLLAALLAAPGLDAARAIDPRLAAPTSRLASSQRQVPEQEGEVQ